MINEEAPEAFMLDEFLTPFLAEKVPPNILSIFILSLCLLVAPSYIELPNDAYGD